MTQVGRWSTHRELHHPVLPAAAVLVPGGFVHSGPDTHLRGTGRRTAGRATPGRHRPEHRRAGGRCAVDRAWQRVRARRSCRLRAAPRLPRPAGLKIGSQSSSLNSALERFSIGIGSLDDRYPTLLSVAFLQLYNHLAENATIRECANETCRRPFVRQRGRAEYGQNRTSSIKYCTRECARGPTRTTSTPQTAEPPGNTGHRACRARADSHRPARSLR